MDYLSNTYPSSSGSSSVPNNGRDKKQKGGTGKRANNNGVKLSTDPQSVAARERRHRISDRFKILQSLVPGGTKMDTVSMLDEAINYVKFLKTQILIHQAIMNLVDQDHDPSLNNYLPDDFLPPQQQYLDSNFVDADQQASTLLPLPDSCFLSENGLSYNAFMK